jgi:glycosyltransferase involved in cell wall biosynthesis
MKLTERLMTLANPGAASATKDAARLRADGDALRDARMYAEAAEKYASYLAVKPDDFDIWVQRGNCLKDSAAFVAAKVAYEAALRLRPDDADVHLQMGHLMKLQGDRSEAIEFYRKSLDLDPNAGAGTELAALGVTLGTGRSTVSAKLLAESPVTFLDVTDLLAFLGTHHRVTGIQRVQTCILHHALNTLRCVGGFGDAPTESGVIITRFDHELRKVCALSPNAVDQLVRSLLLEPSGHAVVKEQIRRVVESGKPVETRASDTYVILGAFWVVPEHAALMRSLKRAGTKVGVLVHDLIPITHPQYVEEPTRSAMRDRFSEVITRCDFALTTSAFVARELTDVLDRELGLRLPVKTIPLAHELVPATGEDDISDDFKSSLPKEYVLCVCTIEARKNHTLLVDVWSNLARKYGTRLPRLVFVGRWAWYVDELRARLEATNHLDGAVMVLAGLSDAELAYAYEHCLFTVFPSFAEGWGLPVGESLAHGKPCIASSTTSIPEVGGDFCRYINPYDVISATAEIERAIVDREDLRKWTARVQTEFEPRTWESVTRSFVSSVRDLAARLETPNRCAAPRLDAGRVHALTGAALERPTIPWRDRLSALVTTDGWRPLEGWGRWSAQRVAGIELATGLPRGTAVRVFLELRNPPPSGRCSLAIQSHDGTVTRTTLDGHDPRWVIANATTDEDGAVRLRLERTGAVQHLDPSRELFVGVSGVAYHVATDVSARLDILETLLLRGNRIR